MTAFYNEIDPFAAAWLRELISQGHIAPGVVDERDIRDIQPAELAGFVQCHFFAGIGVWSYALRRAGWSDERAVWTGSCPCQPFSAAGRGAGVADERHLWPHFFHLIGECRPAVVLGEQGASKDGLGWLDLVSSDLEGAGYAVGAVDLCAAGVGAPHIRQRLYWAGVALRGASGVGLADAHDTGLEGWGQPRCGRAAERPAGASVLDGGVADPDGGNARAEGLQRGGQYGQQPQDSGAGVLADAASGGREPRERNTRVCVADAGAGAAAQQRSTLLATHEGQPGPTNGFWRDADWLFCRDGKWRPVEPGTQPLAHGAPARVGRLRGYGNAIEANTAATFIGALMPSQEAAE